MHNIRILIQRFPAHGELGTCIVVHQFFVSLLCMCKDMTCSLHTTSLVYSTTQTWLRKWLLEITAACAGVSASSSASLCSIL